MIIHPLKFIRYSLETKIELDGHSDDNYDPFESCVGSECDRSDQF